MFTMKTEGFGDIARRMAGIAPKAEHIVAIQMAKDTEQYVPAQTKSLSIRTRVSGDTIIYPGPYARFLYYGKLMIDPKTRSPFATKGATKEVIGTDLNISQAVHGKAQSHWFEASKAQNLDKWRRVAGRAMQREFRK
jgi:hypothetical protein